MTVAEFKKFIESKEFIESEEFVESKEFRDSEKNVQLYLDISEYLNDLFLQISNACFICCHHLRQMHL